MKSSFPILFFRILMLLSLALLHAACTSQTVLRDRDYQTSLSSFRTGDSKAALTNFPDGESGGFITTVEKSWLNLWNQSVDKKLEQRLERQSKTFDARKYLSLTREAGVFLTEESEEGYIPSEAEVVILHLVAAMANMELQRWEDAEVEARAAGFYLQSQQNSLQEIPHFDDPALRIWLAGIWAALGDWNAAQVDLRVAAKLSQNKKLLAISESQAPAELFVSFKGLAPEIKWINGQRSPQFINNEPHPENSISFSSDPWFARHLQRNRVLRDVLLKSNYMTQFLAIETVTAAQRAGSHTLAFVAGGLGVLVGAAIVVAPFVAAAGLGLTGDLSQLFILPVTIGAGIVGGSVVAAKKWDRQMQESLDQAESDSLSSLRTYRLVRFLPEWISIDVKTKNRPQDPFRTLEFQNKGSATKSTFTYQFSQESTQKPSKAGLPSGQYCLSGICDCADGNTVTGGEFCPK